MLGALVQGRVSLDGASTWASALALTIAVTYGNQRRQFDNGAGTPEVTLLDYGKHQRRLLPRLAQVYAQAFAHDELLQMFDGDSFLLSALGSGLWPIMVLLSEIVQTFILADFCYYYVKGQVTGGGVVRLPVDVV